jgi:DNA-binding MurR/RpiR family transcriptional regulator
MPQTGVFVNKIIHIEINWIVCMILYKWGDEVTEPVKAVETMMEILQARMSEFSGRERRVAQALLANYPLAGLDTVASLSATAGVSTATVNRFINKLGFTQFSDFQDVLRRQLQETLNSPLARMSAARLQSGPQDSFLHSYLDTMTANLESLHSSLPVEDFSQVVALLCEPKKSIYVVGGRHTTHVGHYFTELLSSLRPRVYPVGSQTMRWPLVLQDMDAGSVLVALDMRRYQEDVIAFSRLAAEKGSAVVLLTDQWHSPIVAVARFILAFPVVSRSVFDSAAAGFVICEALAGACAQQFGKKSRIRFEHLDALRDSLRKNTPLHSDPKPASGK